LCFSPVWLKLPVGGFLFEFRLFAVRVREHRDSVRADAAKFLSFVDFLYTRSKRFIHI